MPNTIEPDEQAQACQTVNHFILKKLNQGEKEMHILSHNLVMLKAVKQLQKRRDLIVEELEDGSFLVRKRK